jgi:hypothetical protein
MPQTMSVAMPAFTFFLLAARCKTVHVNLTVENIIIEWIFAVNAPERAIITGESRIYTCIVKIQVFYSIYTVCDIYVFTVFHH